MAKHQTPREFTGTTNVAKGIASLSPVVVPLALMLGELLAQHELLVAKLIEQGILDGEDLDTFFSRYEEHLPAARQRVGRTGPGEAAPCRGCPAGWSRQ